jgi:lipopolysaccharide transport system permease protein
MASASQSWISPPPPPAASAWGSWLQGTAAIDIWLALAWYDVSLRYRRSVLGPWWITLSIGAMLIGLGPLYATILQMPMRTYFPHVALGMIFWGFIGGTVMDSCGVFAAGGDGLRNSDCPLSLLMWRCIARHVIELAHVIPLFLLVAIWAGVPFTVETFLFIPGFLLLVVNLHALGLWLGIACARFRDVQQIVATLITFTVFLTPVIWTPESLPEGARAVLDLPVATLLSLVREPLLGKACPLRTWALAGGWTLLNLVIAAVVFSWKRRQVVLWV